MCIRDSIITAPPNITIIGGFSFKKYHAHIGPNTASVNIKIPTIADGVLLAPIVINIKPIPTWKKPAINPRKISFEDTNIVGDKKNPINIANKPAVNWSGNISTFGNFLTTSISTAKDKGITNATILPMVWPEVKLSPINIIIPENAKIIEINVIVEILSFKKK